MRSQGAHRIWPSSGSLLSAEETSHSIPALCCLPHRLSSFLFSQNRERAPEPATGGRQSQTAFRECRISTRTLFDISTGTKFASGLEPIDICRSKGGSFIAFCALLSPEVQDGHRNTAGATISPDAVQVANILLQRTPTG